MRHRLNLLLRIKTIKNISAACRQWGVSRTIYYKYRQRYLTFGIYGLKDKTKKKPSMPNQTAKNVVKKVLDIAKKYPTYGPARLANELGHIVCAATVYNILKRYNLSAKLDRLLAALMSKNYGSISALQADLDKYLYFYNFQRTHQGYRLKGLRPCDKLYSVSELKALTV